MNPAWLLDQFITPFNEPFFVKAFFGGSVTAVVCGVIGCLVILRRMAFLGDALSHAMIAGVGAGYLFVKLLFGAEARAPAMLLGSLIAALITIVLVSVVSRSSRIKEDTSIGIVYCGIFAFGVVLVSVFQNLIHIDLVHFIMGDVLGISDTDLWISVIVAAFVLSLIILFFRYFQIASFDPVMALAAGVPVVLIDYALTGCVSLVVVSAVSMVGVILAVGLLITPAATAYLLTDRLDRMMILAAFFGITGVLGGLYMSIWFDSAGGGAIMLFCTLQFMIVLVLSPKYGYLGRWLSGRSAIPQILKEDVLVSVLKGGGENVPASSVKKYVKTRGFPFVRALDLMSGQGLIKKRWGKITLLDEGKSAAVKLLRSHRLWESYLDRLGMPPGKIHDFADKLEHGSSEAAAEYLEEKLDHPEKDPHGADIPVYTAGADAARPVALSLLRQGQSGKITRVDESARALDLRPEGRLKLGPRRDGGRIWTVILEDGKEIYLTHEQADAIYVIRDAG